MSMLPKHFPSPRAAAPCALPSRQGPHQPRRKFMSRVKATLALLALASLAWTSVAGAQTKVELNPFAGYYVASDIYNTFAGTNGSNVELTNSFMWGGRLTFSTPRGGIEFAYTRTGSDIK